MLTGKQNHPSPCEENWSKRAGPQCRVILLKSGLPPEPVGIGMQVSKSPTLLSMPVPIQDLCASLTEGSVKADKAW